MKYKSDEIREDWERWLKRDPPHEPFMRLYRIMLVIDALSKATGHGEITITCFIRAQDFDSYHSKAQADDFRLRDKSKEFYEAMILFKPVLSRLDPQVQLVPHLELWRKDDQHIHVEIDDNSLQRR